MESRKLQNALREFNKMSKYILYKNSKYLGQNFFCVHLYMVMLYL